MEWLKDNEDKKVKVCELCGKECKNDNLIRVKIEDTTGYGTVYDVCKECVEKNGYTEYDGSDWASDWN